jgi:hypothetical protein
MKSPMHSPIAKFAAAHQVAIVLVLLVQLSACAPSQATLESAGDACIDELAALMESKPVLTHLTTLDGQQVLLADFDRLSRNTACVLPEKFYHWKSEVKWVTADTPRGTITHQIRLYHNYLSTCRPDFVDPGRTYGDVAEFYNENGEFMGLAVYSGQGIYCPLPHAKYRGDR